MGEAFESGGDNREWSVVIGCILVLQIFYF